MVAVSPGSSRHTFNLQKVSQRFYFQQIHKGILLRRFTDTLWPISWLNILRMNDETSNLPRVTDRRRYSLHIKSPKKNIFVTQLADRRDEDEDVNYIPIIRQAAGEILANDSKTLQTTLVLKKEVEVDQVNAELAIKRQAFFQCMEAIAQRRVEFGRKEQTNKERALKFDKFLKDNEAKRCRAIQKYQFEVKQNEVKQKELQDLLQQFEEIKTRQQKLQKKVSDYKVYEDYLLKVIDSLPEDYLECGAESLLMSVIRKYETFSATNETLINNLSRLSDEMEQSQHNLETLHQEYDTTKLVWVLLNVVWVVKTILSIYSQEIFRHVAIKGETKNLFMHSMHPMMH